MVARSGELPIGSGDGVAFYARTDDAGQPLDGRCDVLVSGITPQARYWTLTLYDPEGRLVANSVQRHGFTSQEIIRRADGSFDITVGPRARPGNWLPTGGVEHYRAGAAPLRHADRRGDAHGPRRADACDHQEGLPMIRLALWLLGGFCSAASCIWRRCWCCRAWRRRTPIPAYPRSRRSTPSPRSRRPTPEKAVMPFMDPAFAVSVCRYDLSRGPLKFSVPVSQAYTSVSFYTRSDVAYYAINDRAAGRRVIELDLMTAAQRAELPENEEITAADRLIVESPTTTGLIVIKALAPESGWVPAARSALAAAQCRPQ